MHRIYTSLLVGLRVLRRLALALCVVPDVESSLALPCRFLLLLIEVVTGALLPLGRHSIELLCNQSAEKYEHCKQQLIPESGGGLHPKGRQTKLAPTTALV